MKKTAQVGRKAGPRGPFGPNFVATDCAIEYRATALPKAMQLREHWQWVLTDIYFEQTAFAFQGHLVRFSRYEYRVACGYGFDAILRGQFD